MARDPINEVSEQLLVNQGKLDSKLRAKGGGQVIRLLPSA